MQSRLASLIVVLASAASAQSVHVVDDDGGAGVDHTDIPAAIAAAGAGDTLLVKPGTYSGFTVSKSLTITAETGVTADVGAFEVSGLGGTDTVVLRGLNVASTVTDQVTIENNLGFVALEDCTIEPTPSVSSESVRVSASASVSFVRCAVTGNDTRALLASLSNVHAFDSTFLGGAGGFTGSDAVQVTSSFLFVEDGLIQGGAGLDGVGSGFGCTFQPGPGGDGIATFGASALVALQAATVLGGPSGASPGTCNPAQAGDPVDLTGGGGLTDLGGTAHTLDVTTPVRMGAFATNLLEGEPGEIAVLVIGLAPTSVYFPPWLGVISADALVITEVIGIVPASGSFTVDLFVPFLGFESLQLYEQAAFVNAAGGISLSTACYPIILSPLF